MFSTMLRSATCGVSLFILAAFCGCSQLSSPAIQADRSLENPIEAAVDAAFKGDLEYVKACVESDPRYVEAVDGFGKTLLHYAAEGGHKELVAYLLEHGANVNAQDGDYRTPIEMAGQGKAPKEVIDLLNQAQSAG